MNNFTKMDEEGVGGKSLSNPADLHERDSGEPLVDPKPGIEPLTLSLMGKLFGVPLVIIGSIVSGAVLVVLLFGGSSVELPRTLDELLSTLESSSGEKSLGVLLPREKQLWQTALELAKRLEKKEVEGGEAEIASACSRLAALVEIDLAHLDHLPTVAKERINQRAVRSRRLEFLIHALGRTGRPESIGPLTQVVRSRQEPYVQAAMKEIVELRNFPEAREAIGPMLELLNAPSVSNEAKLVACTAVSALAEQGSKEVIAALTSVRAGSEGELNWSASLALARLGSVAGKSTLLDMLDRKFWESGERYQVVEESGNVKRYRLPAARVDAFLVASIEAVSGLADADLWELVERLKSDPSPPVRAAAARALEARSRNRGRRVVLRKGRPANVRHPWPMPRCGKEALIVRAS